jgi:hypothetical protein
MYTNDEGLEAVLLFSALGFVLALAIIPMMSPEAMNWMIALELTGH